MNRWGHGQRLSKRWWPHGAVSVLAAGAVYAGVWWWGPHSWEALDALEVEVAQLAAGLQGLEPAATTAPVASGQILPAPPDWPSTPDSASVWPWLQQGLQAQGLQVQSIVPLPISTSGPLPEQPVQWRLQGRWRDWLAWLQALEAHAPWWVFDQWVVLPTGTPGQVRIDVQARLGLQGPRAGAARVWPVWPVHPEALTSAGAQAFDPPGARAEPVPGPLTPPTDPRQLSVHELQLLGIWQQGGVRHAVLGVGSQWLVASPGQRVGREAYQVLRVSASGVDLVPAEATQPHLHLGWQGEPK